MERPKLRKVERIDMSRDEQQLTVLYDPLELCQPVALPAELGPVLDRLDGRHTVAQIRQSLLLSARTDIPREDLEGLIGELSEGGWLEDEVFRQRWLASHEAFMAEPDRAPRLAGVLYPEQPNALQAELAEALPRDERCTPDSNVLGVLTPHAPLAMAHEILDLTLRDLPAAEQLDLVVVLGTDHYPGLLPYACTTKPYRTPLGSVPIASRVVQALERRVPWILREELRHHGARSIELTTLLLQHVYGEACPPMLPVLCGQTVLTSDTVQPQVDAFLGSLEVLTEAQNVLWWVSAELSHGGPAYGSPSMAPDTIQDTDEALLDSVARGNAERFAARCLDAPVPRRPSGAAALTTAMRILPVGYGTQVAAYRQVPIPGAEQGTMGLAGLRFLAP